MILLLKKVCDKLPESLEKLAPVLFYPVFGILIMGVGMNFVVEPVMGAINTALNSGLASINGTSKILLGFILGAMMSVDMGGPFNKAAYVFGTASIVAGNYDIMAAVMIGGMVPPCAIALATIIFKDRFTGETVGSCQLHYGTCVHYGGSYSVCSLRPAACTACLHNRCRNIGCVVRAV